MDYSKFKTPPVVAGGGAVLGFLFLGPVGALIGAGLGYAGGKKFGHSMTPEQKKTYDAAMKTVMNPLELRRLADAYEHQGFTNEATQLRKRASLREVPPGVRDARRAGYKAAMASKDPVVVERMAEAHEVVGATGAAANLRKYAASLRKTLMQ